jgi:hypothetical protein
MVGKILRAVLMVLGILLILAGGLWTLQGLGLVMWPAESFMLADRQWAANGAITLLVGLVLVWLSRRRARR